MTVTAGPHRGLQAQARHWDTLQGQNGDKKLEFESRGRRGRMETRGEGCANQSRPFYPGQARPSLQSESEVISTGHKGDV